MILTVTLNTAVDRTVAVPRFGLGRRHRAVESQATAGGKGVNIARALKLLGHPVIATGLAGGASGSRIAQLLTEEEVLHDFTEIAGESRTNLAVVDPTSGAQTEINERGPEVTQAELDAFVARLTYLAAGARLCVIAGSIPPGVDPDIYAVVIAELRRLGVPALLDTDGEPMRVGLRAGPDIVAPNTTEAEEAVGHEFADADDLLAGISQLAEMGAKEAIITRADGCVAIAGEPSRRDAYDVSIDTLDPVSTVGSGDAFLAGYIGARYAGRGTEECLAYGVASGAESTQHFGAGVLDRDGVERLLDRVVVERIKLPLAVG